MPSQFFRANVGVVVAREDGRVLVLERSDRPGQWQFPQGGMLVDEDPVDASGAAAAAAGANQQQ